MKSYYSENEIKKVILLSLKSLYANLSFIPDRYHQLNILIHLFILNRICCHQLVRETKYVTSLYKTLHRALNTGALFYVRVCSHGSLNSFFFRHGFMIVFLLNRVSNV